MSLIRINLCFILHLKYDYVFIEDRITAIIPNAVIWHDMYGDITLE